MKNAILGRRMTGKGQRRFALRRGVAMLAVLVLLMNSNLPLLSSLALASEAEQEALVVQETPVAVSATEAPAETEAPTEAPAETEAPTEVPATEAPTEAPATNAPTEAPATEAPTEVPATETPTEAPATEAPTEAPAGETPTDTPVPEEAERASETEAPVEAEIVRYPFVIGDKSPILLSEVLKDVKLDIDLKDIKSLELADRKLKDALTWEEADPEQAKDDYVLTVLAPFDELELLIHTKEDTYTLLLKKGEPRPAEPEEVAGETDAGEAAEAEADDETPAEETAEANDADAQPESLEAKVDLSEGKIAKVSWSLKALLAEA